MLEKNKVYRARVEGYTSEGLGVARIDGQAVFVHRALRGEDCDILLLKVLKNAAFGKAVKVYTPSPHRTEPDCPYYGRCGGCDFRHMDRAEELDAKRQRVQDALRRIGGSAVTVESIDGGEPLHYRNKSQYPVAADGSVGFYRARSHQVVPVKQCLIQKPQADKAAQALRDYIRTYGVSCYDEKTRRGLVRYLYIRTNGAGQSLLCVLVNGRKLPHEQELVALLREVSKANGVDISIAVTAFPAQHAHERLRESGLQVLRAKQDAGADFAITQVFYDVRQYKALVDDAAEAGIGLPIIPEVMPLVTARRAHRAAELTGVDTPTDLLSALDAAADEDAGLAAGVAHAAILSKGLLDAGAPGIHIITFNRSEAALGLVSALGL